jgi:hypothetical protein
MPMRDHLALGDQARERLVDESSPGSIQSRIRA